MNLSLTDPSSTLLANELTDSLDEASSKTIYALAYQFYEHGHYAEALPLFRFLTDRQPILRKHWMGLAATLLMLKEYEQALSAFSVAALQDPHDPYVHLHAADCLFGMDKTPDALNALEEALSEAAKSQMHEMLHRQIELMLRSWKECKR